MTQEAIVPGTIETGVPDKGKSGRKARSELQVALIEASDELAKIDVALNLVELEWKKADEKHRCEVAKLSQKRATATAKLRASTEAIAKRQVPGSIHETK
jgi:hypothetical protein